MLASLSEGRLSEHSFYCASTKSIVFALKLTPDDLAALPPTRRRMVDGEEKDFQLERMSVAEALRSRAITVIFGRDVAEAEDRLMSFLTRAVTGQCLYSVFAPPI